MQIRVMKTSKLPVADDDDDEESDDDDDDDDDIEAKGKGRR